MFWEVTDEWSRTPALKLLCPECQYPYNHHTTVRDITRSRGEDSPSFETANGRTLPIPESENPSPGRDAVVIDMRCEGGHVWQLQIIQHKGETFCTARSYGQGGKFAQENDAP